MVRADLHVGHCVLLQGSVLLAIFGKELGSPLTLTLVTVTLRFSLLVTVFFIIKCVYLIQSVFSRLSQCFVAFSCISCEGLSGQ